MSGDSSGVGGNLVGRARELRLLDAALAATRTGNGRLVAVAGEAGIGKTSLCREAASRAERAGFSVGWGTGWQEGGAPPLWPWQAVLADLAGLDGAAAPALLADDRGGTVVDPERFARFAAVAELLARACRESPVLIVIDDIQAVDPGAVLLARFIARALTRLPLMLLLTRRRSEDDGAPLTGPLSELERQATSVTLRPLDFDETASFLRSYGYLDVDPDLQRTLWRLTRGNPLFLHRLIALGPAGPAAGRLPPDDARAAIVQAVDRLGDEARRILTRTAVLGSSPLVSHAAFVADCTTASLGEALGEAERVGLVGTEERERFTFTHELIRECLHDRLTVGERREAHARAADLLGPPAAASQQVTGAASQQAAAGPQRLTRYAHHALWAAPRSAGDARRAVAACRAAAGTMVGGFAYEQAAALLEAAVGVYEQAGLSEPVAALIVEWAQAVLSSGRLAEARTLFDRAVDASMNEQDTFGLARAALGLGGVWVNEHRSRPDWERVIGLQRRALAALPAGERRLRCRLTVRLAAEAVYQGGPVEPVLEALAEARRLADSGVLAEALSLSHHALLTPRFTRTRLVLAEELIAVASPAGEGMLALMGLCWRAVDLFHLGDPRAATALTELRDHADALNCRSVLYVAEVIETMLLIRAGRLEEAETKATDCFELGRAVGDADALGYLGAHLVTIRWLQDRDAEILPIVEEVAGSPTLVPAEFAFRATVAALAARAGDHAKARRTLDRLTASGLAGLPESSSWLAGMAAIVESAHVLGDADVARQAYELLEPYADLTVMPSLAVTCFGSAERSLGLAALTFGRPGLAVEHLDRAVAANRLLGNRPVTTVTMADLAGALLRRAQPGDRERAAGLLADARLEAEAIDMTARAKSLTQRLAQLGDDRAAIRRQGRLWVFSVGDHQAVVAHRLGIAYLTRLLTNPYRPIPALELAAADAAFTGSAGQPVIDGQARAAYRRRAEELTRQLADAGPGAAGQAERLRAELDAIVGELSHAAAKGGRTRSFPDPGERARTAVRKAIKRAIDDVAAADPAIGGALRSSITTGAMCCYTPDPEQPLTWALHED
jgi:tetratricopeptide (TPR) repeat protein